MEIGGLVLFSELHNCWKVKFDFIFALKIIILDGKWYFREESSAVLDFLCVGLSIF